MKEYIRIDSAVAEAMDVSPEDQLDNVASEILKTTFTPTRTLSAFRSTSAFERRTDINDRAPSLG
jgi:hypothetical protein